MKIYKIIVKDNPDELVVLCVDKDDKEITEVKGKEAILLLTEWLRGFERKRRTAPSIFLIGFPDDLLQASTGLVG